MAAMRLKSQSQLDYTRQPSCRILIKDVLARKWRIGGGLKPGARWPDYWIAGSVATAVWFVALNRTTGSPFMAPVT